MPYSPGLAKQVEAFDCSLGILPAANLAHRDALEVSLLQELEVLCEPALHNSFVVFLSYFSGSTMSQS